MNRIDRIANKVLRIAKGLQGSVSDEIADEFTRFCLGDSRIALNKLSRLKAKTKSLADSSERDYSKEYGKMFENPCFVWISNHSQ